MNNVLSRISAIFKWISGVFVGITVILNFVAVITRYFFKSPIMWCEEVSLLLFVSSISFALIPMSYSRRAVKLDFFTDLMGRNGRKICLVIVDILSFITLGTTSILGIDLISRSQFRVTPILFIPYGWIYASMVFGMAVSALIFLYFAFVDIRRTGIEKEEVEA